MKFKFFLVLFCIVLTSCSHRIWKPEYKVKRHVLKNGLTVLLVGDRSAPVVSYSTWFKVGSGWEKSGSTGIAHLFEHLMFKGTPKYGEKEFFKRLESKGAVVNAFTQRDVTVYYEVIPSEFLELVIDMESDRLANLQFTQKDLDAEREVVLEERRLRIDSNYSAQHLEVLQNLAFPNHPYGWPVIGYSEDLKRLTLEECREFFDTYYQPANAIVTIAGDFDHEQVKQWLEKYYGLIKSKSVSDLKLEKDVKKFWRKGEKRVEISRPVEAESLLMGYYIPSLYDADSSELSMLAWAIFGMSSGRANVSLVREKQLAMGISAEANLERFPNLFLISASLRTGQSSEVLEREIDALIEEIKQIPLTTVELERVKNRIIFSTVNNAKSPAGVANWLASGEYYWNDFQKVFELLDQYHSITPKDIQRVADKYLRKENRVIVVMKPTKNKPRVKNEK